jgi:hypothetical protein
LDSATSTLRTPSSVTHRKHIAFALNERNMRALYEPERCAHGYQTLRETRIRAISSVSSARPTPRVACATTIRGSDFVARPCLGCPDPIPPRSALVVSFAVRRNGRTWTFREAPRDCPAIDFDGRCTARRIAGATPRASTGKQRNAFATPAV